MKISIITCTYNPDERILGKVLDAVARLVIPADCEVEYLIIDNNSSTPLAALDYVINFLAGVKWGKLFVEKQQGLSFSRLRGHNESTGDIIVFFDDDNVADPDYVLELKRLFENNIQVGIWGPGKIEVVFMDDVPAWVEHGTKGIFQEKNAVAVEFGHSLKESSFHPFGTGMALKREVVQFYYNQFTSGGFKTSDRKGESLASSGDMQLLYAAYKMGLATGVSPSLKMQHLIPAKRTTLTYICRLLYGSYSTGDTAFAESFPELMDNITLPGNNRVMKDLIKRTASLTAIKNNYRWQMDMAVYLGTISGKYKARGVAAPKWLNKIITMLKLDS